MFKDKAQNREELDRLGQCVLNAAVADESEIESAASSLFMFTRIRAAIAENRKSREQAGSWLSLVVVARRAIPAMALVALLAAVLVIWPMLFGGSVQPAQVDEELLFGPAEPGVEQTVLAGRNGLSRDDVFNIVVDRNYEGNGK